MSEQSETRVPHRESPEAEDVERPRPSMFTTAKCYLCSWWDANKGLVYIIIAEQLSSAMNAITRLLETGLWGGSGLHPLQILCFRMSMTLLWTLLYMYWARIPDAPFGAKGLRASLCIRGVAGFVGVAGLYFSLQYLPLAEATVLSFLTPILTIWVASYFLNEVFGVTEFLAALTAFLGVLLIARPGPLADLLGSHKPTKDAQSHVTSAQRLFAVIMGLLGVVGSTTAFTVIRVIGSRVNALITVTYFSGMVTILSTLLLLILPGMGFRLPANLGEWGCLIALGISGVIFQVLLTKGLQISKTSRAMNMMYLKMLTAIILDKLIWNIVPGWVNCIGSLLILVSAAVVATRQEKRQETSKDQQYEADEETALLNDQRESEGSRRDSGGSRHQ